jgi:signal transduction histidine kinase
MQEADVVDRRRGAGATAAFPHRFRALVGQPSVPRRPVLVPRGASWAVYGVFGAFVLIGLALRLPRITPLDGAAAALALAAGLVALRVPTHRLAFVAAVAAAGVAVLGNATASNVGWFAVCVLSGWCALIAPRFHAMLFFAASLALFGAEAAWAERDPGWGAWAAGLACMVLAGLLIGHNLRLVAELRAAQAVLAERARAEERNRIARELHDVIGHSLTVSLLHVASARMAVEYDPKGASRALIEAERLSRETLDEVRATVGLLRVDGDTAEGVGAPLPGLDGLPTLVERFCSAGTDIRYAARGDVAGVPGTVGLAVYRIAQEALTNAAKHAPGASVTVDLAIAPRAVELTVDSSGTPGTGAGMGLASMRERAESLGGTLAAAPGGSGWRVRAVLPLRTARAEKVTS